MAGLIRDLAGDEIDVRVVRVVVPVRHLGTECAFRRVEAVENVDVLRKAVAVVADVVHEKPVSGAAGLHPGHVILSDRRAGSVRDLAGNKRHIRAVVVRVCPVPVEGADRGVEIVVDLNPLVVDAAFSFDPMKEIFFDHWEDHLSIIIELKSITRVLTNAVLRYTRVRSVLKPETSPAMGGPGPAIPQPASPQS